MNRARATIEDVAKAAGVSRQTVSRVINRASNVSQQARQRVEEAIAKLDYAPNLAARGMGGGRSYILLVLMEAGDDTVAYGLPLGDMLLAGLETCSESNYHLMFDQIVRSPADRQGTASRWDADLASQLGTILGAIQPDGVIVLPPLDDCNALHKLVASYGVPLAFLGERSEFGRTTPGLDQAALGEDAARHLIELGHRQIGFIAGPGDSSVSKLRLEGYRRALARSGSRAHRHFVAEAPGDYPGAVELGRSWLTPTIRPTAIITSTAQMALALHQVASECGIAIPRDLSLISLEETSALALPTPPVSSLHLPLELMFANACEQLIAAQTNIEAEPAPGAMLMDRASVARAPRTV